jgi:hypothetical protein
MKKLLGLILLVCAPAFADVTNPTEWTEADGAPSVYDPWKVAFSNGSLTDNGDGSVSISTGGGAGDITAVGDCATGACFDGTTGTSLTFNNAGGDGILSYDGTNFNFDKSPIIALSSASLTIDSSSGATAKIDRGSNATPNNAFTSYATAGTTKFNVGMSGVLHNGSDAYYSLVDAGGNELFSVEDKGSTGIFSVTSVTATTNTTQILSASTTGGVTIESNNGTDVGVLGSSNTANVTWYGTHNFGTTTSIAPTGSVTANGFTLNPRYIVFPVSSTIAASTTTTGQNCAGDVSFQVPSQFNNFKVTTVVASVTTANSSGTLTANIRNRTDSVDILSTALTIDANERSSTTAATPAVINQSNNTITTDDDVCVQVSVTGTGHKGLQVTMGVSN